MAPTAKVRADLNLSGGSYIGMRCQLRFTMAFRTKGKERKMRKRVCQSNLSKVAKRALVGCVRAVVGGAPPWSATRR